MEFYKSGQATVSVKENSSAPEPLGLLGFGLTTFLINLHNAGVYPLNAMIIDMGVYYGGLAQIIAGLLEWKRGNFFASIAFMSYGFFWWSLCMIWVIPKLGWAAAADHAAMGCYLFIWYASQLACLLVL
jgi:succinate-acetate transporter protein